MAQSDLASPGTSAFWCCDQTPAEILAVAALWVGWRPIGGCVRSRSQIKPPHPSIPQFLTGEIASVIGRFAMLVVVIWHWVFTIVVWRPTGPSASSPLAFTDQLWLLTWLLQVMPLFFYVGGYAHL